MSRSALYSHDREAFIKSQIQSCHKALNKTEAPLKQKHARVLIVGTHKEKSPAVFWNTVNHIALEKNPVVTWKFCHLLHKLIRDGHRNVAIESYKYKNRIMQLGNFWQHLRTSGYGTANYSYCQVLAKRLEFHQRYRNIPGSFELTPPQIKAISQDVNECFELSVELLDMVDTLLELKNSITSTMDSLRWSSLILQGQCLLAPLVLVIIDTSKIYDIIVKFLFHLHSQLPADVLAGHRSRFLTIFRGLKKFFEDCGSLQYFQYLVSMPTLPAEPPNFLSAADLDSYQTPQAYLHHDGSEGGDTPTDSRSIAGESTIVDLDFANTFSAVPEQPTHDEKDSKIEHLQGELQSLQGAHQQLLNEAKSRIEAYESRLSDLNADRDYWKERHHEVQEESRHFRESLESSKSQENQAKETEDKFQKLKSAYTTFRAEHLQALRDISDLTKKLSSREQESVQQEEEVRRLRQQMQEAEQAKIVVEEKVKSSATSVDEMESQLAASQMTIENLNYQLDAANKTAEAAKYELQVLTKDYLAAVCVAVLSMLEHAGDDLQNATSMNYPLQLLSTAFQFANASVEKIRQSLSNPTSADLIEQLSTFGYRISTLIVNTAAAAYATSIERYDAVHHLCRELLTASTKFVQSLKDHDYTEAKRLESDVSASLANLSNEIRSLPVLSGDTDAERIGGELESEMDRINKAIQDAVKLIEDLQKKSRASATGARLKVNDQILETCNGLINAIRVLVARSRDVQEEIVQQGKGSASPKEFYKRNHQWTEGLISAAKAVGAAATYFVQSADNVVTNGAKFENLIIAAQEIGASVAQLYVSSRVKADKDSKKMAELAIASRDVNKCTASVVATVKSGQLDLADEKLDFTNLSLHDAKKQEMESQIHMLELEAELEKERIRLAGLRKQHYHLAGLVSSNNGHTE